MNSPRIPDTIKLAARDLRKNMTEAEQFFWNNIRYDSMGYRILRQKPVYVFTEDSGQDRFIIADFFCEQKKLIIEIDGGIHDNTEVLLLDEHKEKLLKNAGYKVVRFRNEDILYDIENILTIFKGYLN